VFGGDPGFFPRVEPDDTEKTLVDKRVDDCFDLARVFRVDPDHFLDKPFADLGFYIEATNRQAQRMKGDS
jgi:hypothetical protein